MMKRMYPILALLVCLSPMSANAFSGGDGTIETPFQISTKHDLWGLTRSMSYWEDHYVQTADIAFLDSDFEEGGPYYNNGSALWCISDGQRGYFTGSYDGNGHTIDNIRIVSTYDCVGLFGNVRGDGVISNLGVTNAHVEGNSRVGILAGRYEGTQISNCFTTGAVHGIGVFTGGLVGYAEDSSEGIVECYSDANIFGSTYAGGLMGWNQNGLVQNCYSTSSVNGTQRLGGLIACNFYDGVIDRCYSTGLVTASLGQYVGGLLYTNRGVVMDCFYDSETCGADGSDGGEGLTSAGMSDQANFEAAGWDFSTPIWEMDLIEGRPCLTWMGESPDITVDVDDFPSDFYLAQNHPNPFNPATRIGFSVQSTGLASLKVYDLNGTMVTTLLDGMLSAGAHELLFDAGKLSSGVYFYVLEAGDLRLTKKMTLIK
jgi:hypothetical protein